MYKAWSREVPNVTSLYVSPNYVNQRVVDPPRNFWQYWVAGGTERWVQVPSLPDLYANGKRIGTLHANGPQQAQALAAMLAQQGGHKSYTLTLHGHDTESGGYIDSLELTPTV